MVRQWQELFFDNRLSGVDLEGNPDFVKLAEAYGIKGCASAGPATSTAVLQARRARTTTGPCVVEAEVVKEDNVFPMIPAGAPLANMIIEPPEAQAGEAQWQHLISRDGAARRRSATTSTPSRST